MGLKIRDKVFIISKEEYLEKHATRFDDDDWAPEMFEFCGKITTITDTGVRDGIDLFWLEIDDGEWCWYDWMLIPYNKAPNVIKFNGIIQEKIKTIEEKIRPFLEKSDLSDDEILEYLALCNYQEELKTQLGQLENLLRGNKKEEN